MTFEAFRQSIESLSHGKKLPGATYLFRPNEHDAPAELWKIISRAEVAAQPDSHWNLLKIHTDQFALTFLTYPDFDTDPHPALAEATKINLNSGSIVRTDYRSRANPPILHRKETFLPDTDPRIPTFAALTKQEEEAGLYREPSRIGLRIEWQTLLKRLNLRYDGHTLVALKANTAADVVWISNPQEERARLGDARCGELSAPTPEETPEVARHRTAIKRYDLSKPVKQLLERGLLKKNDTFFDYGCGHGMDIEALQNLGYRASGWDPAFRPNAAKTPSAVVNLGYVLNVIEDPAERVDVRGAYALAERIDVRCGSAHLWSWNMHRGRRQIR